MRIERKYINSLNPNPTSLTKRLEAAFPDKEFEFTDLLTKDGFSFEEKLWIWQTSTTANQAALFALKCAETVLHLVPEFYAKNKPGKAVVDAHWCLLKYQDNATRKKLKGEFTKDEYIMDLRNAAYAIVDKVSAAFAVFLKNPSDEARVIFNQISAQAGQLNAVAAVATSVEVAIHAGKGAREYTMFLAPALLIDMAKKVSQYATSAVSLNMTTDNYETEFLAARDAQQNKILDILKDIESQTKV